MSFGEDLQGRSSHDALVAVQEAEIRLLENIKKCLTSRIKLDREYAAGLADIIATANKFDSTEFNSPVFQVRNAVPLFFYCMHRYSLRAVDSPWNWWISNSEGKLWFAIHTAKCWYMMGLNTGWGFWYFVSDSQIFTAKKCTAMCTTLIMFHIMHYTDIWIKKTKMTYDIHFIAFHFAGLEAHLQGNWSPAEVDTRKCWKTLHKDTRPPQSSHCWEKSNSQVLHRRETKAGNGISPSKCDLQLLKLSSKRSRFRIIVSYPIVCFVELSVYEW